MKDAMEKMPAGATIARAYGFLIRRFLGNLGLAWLPVAIYAAGAGALAPFFFARAARIAEFGPGIALWREEIELLTLFVAGLAIIAVPAVALSRLALGLEKDRFLAHFTFGAREARLFLAGLRLLLVFAAIAIAVGAAAYLLVWAVASFDIMPIPLYDNGLPSLTAIWESPTLGMGVSAAETIAAAAMLYAGVRCGFFLPSLAACDEEVSLRRCWELSAGQFWRMLAVVLAIVIPVWALGIAGSYFALGADFGRFYGFAVAPDQIAQHLAGMAAIVAAHAAPLMAVKAAGLFLFSALFFPAFAGAYGAMTRSSARPDAKTPPMSEEAAPVAPPVAVAAAASEPGIERSLLEQFGADVHDLRRDPFPRTEDAPAHETHVASNGAAPPFVYAASQTAAEPDDILELEAAQEIIDPPFPQKREEHAHSAHALHV